MTRATAKGMTYVAYRIVGQFVGVLRMGKVLATVADIPRLVQVGSL